MPMEPVLAISLLAFATGVIGAWGLCGYWEACRRQRVWRARVAGTEEPLVLLPPLTSWGRRFLRGLERLGRAVPTSLSVELSQLPNLYVTAGYRDQRIPHCFSGSKVVGLCLMPAALLLVDLLWLHANWSTLSWGAAVLALGGWYGPDVWLRHQAESRKRRLAKSFPDALDLLVVTVEAGLGLDAALTRVAREIQLAHEDLGEELRRLALELRTGRSRQQAMQHLGLRTQVEAIRSFGSMLMQTERFGTSLAQSLRVHADALRTQQQLSAEELAAKLPVKLLFPLIVFILPLVFLIVMGPAILQTVRLFPSVNP